MIAINQDPLGEQAVCVHNCDDWQGTQLWKTRLHSEYEVFAVALINFSDKAVYGLNASIKWREAGLSGDLYHIYDVTTKHNWGIRREKYDFIRLDAHETRVVRLTKAKAGDCEMHGDQKGPFIPKPCPTQ